MQQYFDEHNRQRAAAGLPLLSPHRPQLSNFCRQPVLLKP